MRINDRPRRFIGTGQIAANARIRDWMLILGGSSAVMGIAIVGVVAPPGGHHGMMRGPSVGPPGTVCADVLSSPDFANARTSGCPKLIFVIKYAGSYM